ncbi:MAG: L-threonylcarbamoyladenylate synthase [Myxococcota bacterium]|nr:L-threonylcarbamoyladenylate synthase [Myxococcota bacterium]
MSGSDDAPTASAADVAHLRDGGLLAFPTETVWGLGADARSDAALARLAAWKGRASDQPIAILVEGPDALGPLGIELPPAAARLARRHWPGPLTLVLPSRGRFAPGVARADGAVGVRCSSHPVAAALARACAAAGVGPLTATSLNRSGEPPARSRREAAALCEDVPDAPRLADTPGPDASGGAPSSVVDCCGADLAVLRYGALGPEDLAPRAGDPR